MYKTFIIKLPFIFFLLCICAPYFYADDKSEAQALEQLRKEIARFVVQKSASPIQTVLKRHKVLNATEFSLVKNSGDSSAISGLLPKKRSLNITAAEWQALKKSDITVDDAEDDNSGFTLLDLDEDGLRDLIVDSYNGGTGLSSYVSVYRQRGGRFISQSPPAASGESTNGLLYSINGRGADQEADWVRINGRVYLAYRNGRYGRDDLLLMRAFAPLPDKLKGLSVEYNYRHTLPQIQRNEAKGWSNVKIEAGLYAALQKGLTRLQTQSKQGHESEFGQCPVPANLSPEKQEEYSSSWFGPPHYTFDIAADFPVFEGNRCYAARLVSFKSSDLIKGRYIATALWLVREPDSMQEEFEVLSARFAQSVRIGEIEDPFEDS